MDAWQCFDTEHRCSLVQLRVESSFRYRSVVSTSFRSQYARWIRSHVDSRWKRIQCYCRHHHLLERFVRKDVPLNCVAPHLNISQYNFNGTSLTLFVSLLVFQRWYYTPYLNQWCWQAGSQGSKPFSSAMLGSFRVPSASNGMDSRWKSNAMMDQRAGMLYILGQNSDMFCMPAINNGFSLAHPFVCLLQVASQPRTLL
jgi:hypothetical protein